MKKVRFYTALALRVFGYILNLPSALFYDLSNIIKNKEDEFTF